MATFILRTFLNITFYVHCLLLYITSYVFRLFNEIIFRLATIKCKDIK
jgi:hypothetical protein